MCFSTGGSMISRIWNGKLRVPEDSCCMAAVMTMYAGAAEHMLTAMYRATQGAGALPVRCIEISAFPYIGRSWKTADKQGHHDAQCASHATAQIENRLTQRCSPPPPCLFEELLQQLNLCTGCRLSARTRDTLGSEQIRSAFPRTLQLAATAVPTPRCSCCR